MFWALLESVNGVDVHAARVDAAVTNQATPKIRAVFALSAMGSPNSNLCSHTTTLYVTEPLEVKSDLRRQAPVLAPAPAHRQNVRTETAGVELPPARIVWAIRSSRLRCPLRPKVANVRTGDSELGPGTLHRIDQPLQRQITVAFHAPDKKEVRALPVPSTPR